MLNVLEESMNEMKKVRSKKGINRENDDGQV
jgi:hypothetical protein